MSREGVLSRRRRLVLVERFRAVLNRPFRINLNRRNAARKPNIAGLKIAAADKAIALRFGEKINRPP